MALSIVKKIFGTKSDREVKTIYSIVDDINHIYKSLSSKSDNELLQRTAEFREEISLAADKIANDTINQDLSKEDLQEKIHLSEQLVLEEILPEAFAIVKETCRRLKGETWKVVGQPIKWEMIPYDVQLVGAVVLHRGKVAEMKTGEGKTLVATMPIYLNALSGRGVHVVTVNDYLAQRDAEWMGKIYERLGLTVGSILNQMSSDQRREIYARDITYGTNNEFGFDYLRDNMSLRKEDQVQREYSYAVIDEVDSILIDEARTPLIISGAVDQPNDSKYKELRPLVQKLVKQQTSLVNSLVNEADLLLNEGKDEEAGYKLLQALRGSPKNRRLQKVFQEQGTRKLAHNVESEFLRDKRLHEVDEELFFSIDEKSNVIDLTEKGRTTLAPENSEMFVIPDLGEMLHELDSDSSLNIEKKAEAAEEARLLHSSRSEQIHNITQLLRAYSLYEKDVDYVVQDGKVLIVDEFTGRILSGRRYSEGLHQALEAKENVTIERETQTLATITIQNYFRLYSKLSGMTGTAETESEELHSIYKLDVTVIPTHQDIIRDDRDDLVYKTKREKYNAVLDEVSDCYQRGQPVLVGTISVEASETLSRMIKRKGIPHNVLNAKQHQSEAEIVALAGNAGAITIATNMAGRGTDIKLGEGVKELGGLHIVGTERHESRRIDLQLRGRSGRQGDPGSSVFYLSLEDDLMRLFNSERIASIMDKLGVEEGEVITAGMVTKSIERAQKKVEARNFSIRKRLLEYDDVMNQQREVVYARRNEALHGDDIQGEILDIRNEYIDETIDVFSGSEEDPIDWNWELLQNELSSVFTIETENSLKDIESLDSLKKLIFDESKKIYEIRESLVPSEVMRGFERYVVLRTIDEMWKDHLYSMDQLREGINLRAYGQKDPLLEYKSEGFDMFLEFLRDVNKNTIQRLYRTRLQGMDSAPELNDGRSSNQVKVQHDEASGMGFLGSTTNTKNNSILQNSSRGLKPQPINVSKKVGRNEQCPCGSGKKYKKCHGN
ncbi:MAG: preprotein translocase subunit SecA [Candidatus Marinimicrobia bacterium]|nr:preprotein translocase subunit SecA [Candidatus Neomarinimicrobiota bacterium]|tara:strand:- start:11001 stop:14021 length:3021 start_codon:yes stop_codon:yes gene_type:complete